MKKMLLILTVGLILLLSQGCSRKAQPIPAKDYDRYPLLFEVAYDSKCTGLKVPLQFYKGQRFAPYDIKDVVFINESGIGSSHLPNHAVGLHVYGSDVNLIALIYPDGSFLSNDIHIGVGDEKMIINSGKECTLNNNQPLFKPIKAEELK